MRAVPRGVGGRNGDLAGPRVALPLFSVSVCSSVGRHHFHICGRLVKLTNQRVSHNIIVALQEWWPLVAGALETLPYHLKVKVRGLALIDVS